MHASAPLLDDPFPVMAGPVMAGLEYRYAGVPEMISGLHGRHTAPPDSRPSEAYA
jgi:hypothetical protein